MAEFQHAAPTFGRNWVTYFTCHPRSHHDYNFRLSILLSNFYRPSMRQISTSLDIDELTKTFLVSGHLQAQALTGSPGHLWRYLYAFFVPGQTDGDNADVK